MSSDRQEDAEKALNVARQRLDDGKFEVARRLANKSKSIFPTAAADALLAEIQRKEASPGGSGSGSSQARASGAEAHPSAAGTHQRPGHHTSSNGSATGSSSTASTSKVREFTPEQHAVVKRVRACKVTEYYAILDRELLKCVERAVVDRRTSRLQCKRRVPITMFERRTVKSVSPHVAADAIADKILYSLPWRYILTRSKTHSRIVELLY